MNVTDDDIESWHACYPFRNYPIQTQQLSKVVRAVEARAPHQPEFIDPVGSWIGQGGPGGGNLGGQESAASP